MIELFLALLIGLIAAGIVVTMLRDSRRHGYPSGYRRRGDRPERGPVEAETRAAPRGDREAYEDEAEFVEPAPAPVAARRRETRAVASAPSSGSERGESRSGLLVAGVALAAAAVVLVAIVARSWDGGASPATNDTPEGGGGAAATAGATPTAPAGAARTATPAPSATRTSTPAPANAATLEVQARQQANVRVTVYGRSEFEGTLRAGETRSWAGSARVQLWTDNGKNVAVTVNGFDLGALATAVGHPDWNTVDWGWAAGWRP